MSAEIPAGIKDNYTIGILEEIPQLIYEGSLLDLQKQLLEELLEIPGIFSRISYTKFLKEIVRKSNQTKFRRNSLKNHWKKKSDNMNFLNFERIPKITGENIL